MAEPFPVLRRFSAASPKALDGLAAGLGAHPFALLVEGRPDQMLARHTITPVALDPGTDLTEWASLEFHDDHGPVGVTTSGIADGLTVPLQPLRDFAERWAESRPVEYIGEVVIEERLIRRVGRGGALVDAQLAGGDPDLDDLLVVYRDADAAGFIADEVIRLGPGAFADRFDVPLDTAKSWAAGRKTPSPAQVSAFLTRLRMINVVERTCGLDQCATPVNRPNATYCTKAHRDAAYRLRKKAATGRSRRRLAPDPFADDACPGCGTVLLGAAAIGPCPVCRTTKEKGVAR